MLFSALDRLSHLHPTAIDLSLERVEALLAKLGNPEERLPPVIHVAGTNGKGSTVAFLRALFEARGKTVHVYTSPHLVRFAERIRVAGHLLDDALLEALLEEVEDKNAGAPITFFEATTAAAFLAFSRTPADITLLETGLGGRLDATNVVETPLATVITPVDMDHERFLGETLAEIAHEKAGIIKPGVPCFSAAQKPEALAVLRQKAAEHQAPLLVEGRDFSVTIGEDRALIYRDGAGRPLPPLPSPGLGGDFQYHNAALALATVLQLQGEGEEEGALARGLREVQWPGRLQRLKTGPLVECLPQGWELWIDGGHNPHAGGALGAHAQRVWRDKPLYAVVGMLEGKDMEGYLRGVAGSFAALRAVCLPGGPSSFLGADLVAETARGQGVSDSKAAASLEEAVQGFLSREVGRILVCGSLYLVGAVLRENT